MSRGMYKSVNKGRPALVCMPTDKTVKINGRLYRIVKLAYDLKGEFMPPATMQPQ